MDLSLKLRKLRAENQVVPLNAAVVMHALVHNYAAEDIDHLLQILVNQAAKIEFLEKNSELFDEIIHMTTKLQSVVREC